MKRIRLLAAITAFAFTLTTYCYGTAQAATTIPTQPSPQKLAITALNPNSEPAIGYSAADGGASGYYADIGWASVANPSNISITGKYVNIYLEEQAKGYRAAKPSVLKEKDIPADTAAVRLRNLNSGTIYKASAKAYYEYTEGTNNTRLKSDESASSNTVKFLTDIKLQTITWGTNQVKIIWDDVWNEGKRVSYKLYVSENKDFANTLPIYITDEQISDNGPVRLNQADGTLEYIHNVKDSGRVYYVKVEPEISDPEIKKNPSSPTSIVSTYILVKTTKLSTSDAGTIWRLDWSPVVTGISTSDIKVSYQIDKYVGNVPIPMLIEDSNTTFITVPPDEEVSYYIIRASVTKNGMPLYPDNVKILSDKIILKDQEVPATPPTPEIVSEFKDSAGNYIIAYSDIKSEVDGSIIKKGELGKETATILWRAPKKADGSIDTSIKYDIWLITDPSKIDAPGNSDVLVTNFIPSDNNYVKDPANNNAVIGYKYKLEGLAANHTYYFKIVAKKTFAEEVDGIIQSVDRISNPSLKVVITLAGGAIDRPLLPSNPPLEIKKENEKYLITDKQVTILLKNRWYEQFNAGTGQWSFIRADKTTLNDTPPYDPTKNPPDDLNYRKVEYDEGVTLSVGCVEYYEGIDINSITTYALEKVSTNANDPGEDQTLNAPENIPSETNPPVYKKHNVIVPVQNLKPNTTYILWVRAVRDGTTPLVSEPSNPIIFTTMPTKEQIVEKPIVPSFNYSYVADNYVDLGWTYKDNNTYYIKYGKVDDISKATGDITVTAEQIKASGVNYVRIPGLSPDTQYYFWIQAEAFSSDRSQSKKSEWSDSLTLRTAKDIPPSTPRGFGVKNTADAVGKNYITFEWIKEENISYVLEVASGVDYSDAKKYEAGSTSEFKVDGLKSNYRYFARLYAVDNTKKLTSLPTNSISVRTLRSSDDYDSDQDIDNVISGDIVEKGTSLVNGVWTVKIVGVNADRLVEIIKTDNRLDYWVDLTNPPSTPKAIAVIISKKVMDNLEQLGENISLRTQQAEYLFKAGALSIQDGAAPSEKTFIFTITTSPAKPATNQSELVFKNPLTQMDIAYDNGTSKNTIARLTTYMQVMLPYTDINGYKEGTTKGYVYNSTSGKWQQLVTSAVFNSDVDKGSINMITETTGLFGVADITNNLYDDIYDHPYEQEIINVALAHRLKSVDSRLISPYATATLGDSVKFALDTLDYNYDNQFMDTAIKAGLVKAGSSGALNCTREQAAAIAAAVNEIKSSQRANASASSLASYKDYSSVDSALAQKVAFAVQNGFVPNVSGQYLYPKQAVTRGEVLYMLEKALVLSGEID